MIILGQGSQTMFAAGYLIIPFIILVLVLVCIYLRNHLRDRRSAAISEPFERQTT